MIILLLTEKKIFAKHNIKTHKLENWNALSVQCGGKVHNFAALVTDLNVHMALAFLELSTRKAVVETIWDYCWNA